eukprot:3444794-Ditylum_brightwellii.AAC.1
MSVGGAGMGGPGSGAGTQECFMLLGGANATEELLLHLLSTKQQTMISGNDSRNADCVMADLSTAIKNNNGLALLMEGKGQQTILMENKENTSFDHVSALSQHFNLSLVLWRDGHKDKATFLWLHMRGMGQLTRKNISSNEHRKLKSDLEKAFNRHGLHIAEKNKHGRGS